MALVRVILLLGSIAVVSWSLLTSVSSWFYGTGIGREGGRYLLRKGNLVIDPGQTLGAVLYAVSLVLIWSSAFLVLVALILLIRKGSARAFQEAFSQEGVESEAKLFRAAALTLAIPWIVLAVTWACRKPPP